MEGVRGRYLLNGDVNNADDSTSDSISRSIARPVSGVSVLPRTIEARIDSVPGGTGKGYKTYRCLVLSDASSVDATKQIAMDVYIYTAVCWKISGAQDADTGPCCQDFRAFESGDTERAS